MDRNSLLGAGIGASRLFGTALVFVACSSDGAGTTTSREDNVQVAGTLAANASTSGEPAAFNVLVDLASGLVPDGLLLDGSGQFSGQHRGLTFNGSITCVDVGTSVQVPCGLSTATARVSATWTGSLVLPRVSIAITRSGNWTLTGLQTATVTIDGTAHSQLNSEFASASDENHKQLELVSDATYQAVAVDRASRMPIGGDIEYALTGSRTHTTPGLDTSDTFTVDATLTFHADHTATLVIDNGGDFKLDLVTGEAIQRE